MDKTIVVSRKFKVKHPMYGKLFENEKYTIMMKTMNAQRDKVLIRN